MPGSTTLGHGHGADAIDHPDALRLTAVLRELHRLLTTTGADRITDAQAAALSGGDPYGRGELADWVERVTRELERVTT
ncbi:hypothetical protein ACF065_02135 [Streptomyces sp. NPDC015232]|uniref:hypothetical protein n=1 Tax=unclassified Streptomyces TaxID=2593676 RepID=UPI0036F9F49B